MKNLLISTSIIMIMVSIFGCSNKNNGNKAGIPKPDHIVIVIEENHSFDQIIGSYLTPYINELAEENALFTRSYGVAHPSQPNYFALYAGSTFGIGGGCILNDTSFVLPLTEPNLGANLIKNGYTFAGYAQSLPPDTFACSYKKSKLNGYPRYGRKHCPWINWIGDGENQIPSSTVFDMSDFPKNFDSLPTVSFVIPDMDYDMHNNPVDSSMMTRADTWLKKNLRDYIEWSKTNNSLFILTFDEDNYLEKNRIVTIFAGEMVKPGKYDDTIDHYNVLRTIEAMYDLENAGPAKADIITNVWKK